MKVKMVEAKTMFKKILIVAILLTSIMFFSTMSIQNVFASNLNPCENVLQQIYGYRPEIEKILVLKDFNGKEYLLYEVESKGYFIFDKQTLDFLEGEIDGRSPYYEYDDQAELIYAGFRNYFIHTKDNRYFDILNDKEIQKESEDYYAEITDSMQKQIYVNKENSRASQQISGNLTFDYINDYKYIVNMFEDSYADDGGFGYVDENGQGLCGYIALAIQLAYNYNIYGSSWIPNRSHVELNDKGTYRPTTDFVRYLRTIGATLGIGNGTVPKDIRDIAIAYAKIIGKSINYYSEILPIFNTIRNRIRSDKATALFGNLTNEYVSPADTGNHVVVAYGTITFAGGTNVYIVHYGWPKKVYPNGVMPSQILLSTTNCGLILGGAFTIWQ